MGDETRIEGALLPVEREAVSEAIDLLGYMANEDDDARECSEALGALLERDQLVGAMRVHDKGAPHEHTEPPTTAAGPVLTEDPEDTMLYVHDHGDDLDPSCRFEVCLTIAGERWFPTEAEARAALGEVQAALVELAAASPHTDDRTEPPPGYTIVNRGDDEHPWWDIDVDPNGDPDSREATIAGAWAHYDKKRGAR